MMCDRIKQNADRLTQAIADRFEIWKRSPEAFAYAYPGVVMTVDRQKSPKQNALRSIANDVMMGSRFDWRVLEFFGADPMFAMGQYDPERPER